MGLHGAKLRVRRSAWKFGSEKDSCRATSSRKEFRGHRRALLRKNPDALHPEVSADAADVRDTKAEGEIARREAGRLVSLLLEELDDDKREVFVLAELEQMTAPEIALAIGVPANTVSSRLRGARLEFAAAAARHRARDEWRSG